MTALFSISTYSVQKLIDVATQLMLTLLVAITLLSFSGAALAGDAAPTHPWSGFHRPC